MHKVNKNTHVINIYIIILIVFLDIKISTRNCNNVILLK